MEEVGTAISDFGAGGRRRQDVGDLLQGGVPSGATVRIRKMSHDPMHRKDNGGISPLGVPPIG